MVVPKASKSKWLRKYRLFFLIGIIILSFQIFLALRFVSSTTSQPNSFYPQNELLQEPIPNNKIQSPINVNTTLLRLEELDFQPECEITGKETISAISRAKTQFCKQLIVNVTCQSQLGLLYPKSLTSNCPNNGRITGRALGCFKDESSYRLLNGYFGVYKKNNSPAFCVNMCLQSGFRFAGVEYSNECFCGNDEPASKVKLADSSCNMKCPGDSSATCGGYYTVNVFETGIRKFVPQTANSEYFDAYEEPVRIVFLLTINGRALRQVKRLLKILYHKKHYYYIHVDVREDYLFRELLYLEKRFPNIRLTRKRFATIWGGASLLKMLLNCMNELLELKEWHWDFIINLSESDYPVKMIGSLERFLTANRGQNFVKSHGRDTQRFLQKQGLDKTFVECETRMWRVGDRHLPNGIQIDGGSDWIALSRDFVEYVAVPKSDPLISGLLQVFHYTLLPAESFFHTALRNSKFCDTYIDNNLHVTNWKRKLGCKCQYKHVVDWCGCSPNDFRLEDWSRIQATLPRQLYFARKFEPIINQQVLLKLELWLYGLDKPSHHVPNLHSYWQSIYNANDLSPVVVDDGLLTILTSAIRNWLKSFNCQVISLNKILEANSYHLKDEYKYTLVNFEIKSKELIIPIEIGFRPVNTLVLNMPETVLSGRLEELIVSSDYDQKEQLSRNFIKILSPYSDPVLIYKFTSANNVPTTNNNLTCLWIDPIGQLLYVSEIELDNKSTIGHIKPILKQPHLPGVWTIKLLDKNLILGEIKFLITPLQFYSNLPITKQQTNIINGGFVTNNKVSSKDNNTTFKRFLLNDNDRNVLYNLSASNSKRFGNDLFDWIDSLFNQFYVIEKVCFVKQVLNICGDRLSIDLCSNTNWSSFALDPKSTIDRLNDTSGSFNVW